MLKPKRTHDVVEGYDRPVTSSIASRYREGDYTQMVRTSRLSSASHKSSCIADPFMARSRSSAGCGLHARSGNRDASRSVPGLTESRVALRQRGETAKTMIVPGAGRNALPELVSLTCTGRDRQDPLQLGRVRTMAILTVGTPTPEDHFWHILRTIDPVVTGLRAYTEDQRNVLSKDHTSDALYLIQALITSLQLDPEAQATVRDSGECRAELEERPANPWTKL